MEAYKLPRVLLVRLGEPGQAGEALQTLLGTCLQSVLEKHGSGLEGIQLTEEVGQILAMVCSALV